VPEFNRQGAEDAKGNGQEWFFLLENILASSSLAPWRLGGSNLEHVVGMRVLE
jgi:hypothetical protein